MSHIDEEFPFILLFEIEKSKSPTSQLTESDPHMIGRQTLSRHKL